MQYKRYKFIFGKYQNCFSRNRLFSGIKYWRLWRKKCTYNVYYQSQNITSLKNSDFLHSRYTVTVDHRILCIESWPACDTCLLICFSIFFSILIWSPESRVQSPVQGPILVLYYACWDPSWEIFFFNLSQPICCSIM